MKPSVLTIGTFDGVHRGHRKIFSEVAGRARALGLGTCAITFNVPPRLFFFPSSEPALLTTVREKKELLKSCGIEKTFVLQFNKDLARLPASEFFEKHVVGACRAKEVIVGYNFGFGKNREGDARFLEDAGRRCGIGVRIIPPVVYGSVPVSSGRIREALREGDLKRANALLGEPYGISGKVAPGQKLGVKLGFPTANLEIDAGKILPLGVFAVRCLLPGGKVRGGVANIGFRPTVAGGRVSGSRPDPQPSVEVHIFRFAGNLYGKFLKVSLIEKIREEKAFPNLSGLRAQIKKDADKALKVVDEALGK